MTKVVRRSFLLCALLIGSTLVTSCESADYAGKPVDYGPQAPLNDVLNALKAPLAGSDPSQTKLGAFVHFSTVQSIGVNQYVTLTTDTGHTVIDKTETTDAVTYRLFERKHMYKPDGTVDKLSREFEISFDKAAVSSASVSSASKDPNLRSFTELTKDMVWSHEVREQLSTLKSSTETYHRLLTRTYSGAPPPAVRAAPNCLGIPNCEMTFHYVSFDQVFWNNGKGDRIRWEFLLSPDVPQISGFNMSLLFDFYPGLVKSCVSLMVPVGESGTKTLLTECQQVVNFRFESVEN